MKWLNSARVICTAAALVAVCVSSLSCSNGSVRFPDPNLEAAIRDAIDKPSGPILLSDLESLASLTAPHLNISELSGLEHCTGLTQLRLYDNDITDTSPLSELTRLEWLTLGDNQISNVAPLSGLTGLTTLGLDDNKISDISPLSKLTNLVVLFLDNNQISDISPLSNLTDIAILWLEDNRISDISPLVNNAGLASVDLLYLSNNSLSAVSIDTYIPQLEARGVEVIY